MLNTSSNLLYQQFDLADELIKTICEVKFLFYLPQLVVTTPLPPEWHRHQARD